MGLKFMETALTMKHERELEPPTLLTSQQLATVAGRLSLAGGADIEHRTLIRSNHLNPCLVGFKIAKLYKILHHIEYLNACMKY